MFSVVCCMYENIVCFQFCGACPQEGQNSLFTDSVAIHFLARSSCQLCPPLHHPAHNPLQSSQEFLTVFAAQWTSVSLLHAFLSLCGSRTEAVFIHHLEAIPCLPAGVFPTPMASYRQDHRLNQHQGLQGQTASSSPGQAYTVVRRQTGMVTTE